MSRKKNKKAKTNIQTLELNQGEQTNLSLPNEPRYLLELNAKLNNLQTEIEQQTLAKDRALQYLTENHHLYQTIKKNAFDIQKKIIDGSYSQQNEDEYDVDAVYFDFENSMFCDGIAVKEMPACYLSSSDNLHLCRTNGIYVDAKLYSAAKLFLTEKNKLNNDISYIASFEKTIDYVVNKFNLENSFSCFCMLPEAVDLFNTRIRRCLNTNKGKILSIPKSVAISYNYLSRLNYGDRYCVIDMDGIRPTITQLSIGKDEQGNKIILREGFVTEKGKISYTYLSFAAQYISAYERKYGIVLSKNEKENLIGNKQLIPVFSQKREISLFRNNGKIIVAYDEEIYTDCLKSFSFSSVAFKNYTTVFVVSSLDRIVAGNSVILTDNEAAFKGLFSIREILLNNKDAVIWKERLPRVSLEVIDEESGRFKTINLIEEGNEGQNIRLSVDEEIELPFRGTITLQKGKKEYFLPLEREIYSEDVNSAKEAYFYDKSFPLDDDIPVELIVKYNYTSDSPIKIYARPKTVIEEFQELPNIWVDRHEIKEYSGPVYEGHPKEIRTPFNQLFAVTKFSLKKFLEGKTDLAQTNFAPDKAGNFLHTDLMRLSKAYFFLRSTFDPANIINPAFEDYYNGAGLDDFWEITRAVLNANDSIYGAGNIGLVKQYKQGLIHPLAEIVVASWYYDGNNDDIEAIYDYLSSVNKTKVLIKLSRCILTKKDDVYDVFEQLAKKLYFAFKASQPIKTKDERKTYIRTLSQNCWFCKDWLSLLYQTQYGPNAIQSMEIFIAEYLKSQAFTQSKSKEYRDIMEFLVCLTMVKNIDNNMFNPNDDSTRELLENVKSSFETIRTSVEPDKLTSRLEMMQDQGPLFGYPNYIYMLIMILSGEGQVNLVGYRDE